MFINFKDGFIIFKVVNIFSKIKGRLKGIKMIVFQENFPIKVLKIEEDVKEVFDEKIIVNNFWIVHITFISVIVLNGMVDNKDLIENLIDN